MRDPEKIEHLRTAVERNIKAIRLRPSIGQGTAVTKVTVRGGCTCDIEDGGWKLVADDSVKDGGNGEGPDPGVFGRAALGSCVAMGYAMWAAVLGVPLTKIEVEVQADYDARGMFGIDDTVTPGWSGMRYAVTIESPAAEADVMRVLDEADRVSPLVDDFRRALTVERQVQITAPAR